MRRQFLLPPLVVAATALLGAPRADAGTILLPTATAQKPFVVPADAHGDLLPFTITGSGWTPNRLVYILVCDGVPPSSKDWLPDGDCDTATEPAGVKADAQGKVTFPASNLNFDLTAFRGASPQSQFNCLSAHQRDPGNNLKSFTNCQIRMTENDTVNASTDAYLPIALPDAPGTSKPGSPNGQTAGQGTQAGGTVGSSGPSSGAGGPATGQGASGHALGKTGSGAGSSGGWILLLGASAVVVAGLVLFRRRSRSTQGEQAEELVDADAP